MSNTESFFNKSSLIASLLTKDLHITKDVEFTGKAYITDVIKGGTATTVSARFGVKAGRSITWLSGSNVVWVAPATQPVYTDEEIENKLTDPGGIILTDEDIADAQNTMWPVNVWSFTATIVDATWDGESELLMEVMMEDVDTASSINTLTVNKGE